MTVDVTCRPPKIWVWQATGKVWQCRCGRLHQVVVHRTPYGTHRAWRDITPAGYLVPR
jgi:hypothetical protein